MRAAQSHRWRGCAKLAGKGASRKEHRREGPGKHAREPAGQRQMVLRGLDLPLGTLGASKGLGAERECGWACDGFSGPRGES